MGPCGRRLSYVVSRSVQIDYVRRQRLQLRRACVWGCMETLGAGIGGVQTASPAPCHASETNLGHVLGRPVPSTVAALAAVWPAASRPHRAPRVTADFSASAHHESLPVCIRAPRVTAHFFASVHRRQSHGHCTQHLAPIMSKDADDVADFLNLLPDAANAKGNPDDADLLEFFNELSAAPSGSEVEPNPVPAKTLEEPKEGDVAEKAVTQKAVTQKVTQDLAQPLEQRTQPLEQSTQPLDHNTQPLKEGTRSTDENKDTLSSLLSWFGGEATSKVSSFWGLLTTNAQQLGESTYQLASSTTQQLLHHRHREDAYSLADRLNLVLGAMSQQIKDGLVDREDELLNILLVYDWSNVDYLDRLCANKFQHVLSQVEGGIRVAVSNYNHKHNDEVQQYYDLNLFHGKQIDAEKLCFANLENLIKEYSSVTSSVKLDIHTLDVFLAIQPVTLGSEVYPLERTVIDVASPTLFSFTLVLKDITNNISIVTRSQPLPLRWTRWVAGSREDVDKVFGTPENGEDAVDPSTWVKDWIRDTLALAFAVLAQEYVTMRMGL